MKILLKLPESKVLKLSLVAVGMILPGVCLAGDFRFSASLGYGGGGVSKLTAVGSDIVLVKRSEAPGSLMLALDYLLDDDWTVAFEHYRGFRLAPFSSGVSFTGFAGRWYFRNPVPSVSRKSPEGSTLLVKRITPYLGFSAGVAAADISRDFDQVPEVKGSGICWGYRLGAEYPLSPGKGVRVEFGNSNTLQSNGGVQTNWLQFGLYFFL